MKKKILNVETFVNGEKVDVLSSSPCVGENLMAILQLVPVGAEIKISVDEIEIPHPSFTSSAALQDA